MPVWVKGNQCFMTSTTAFNVGDSSGAFKVFNPTLVPATSTPPLSLIWQPGVIRGFNMYVGANTVNKDVTLSLLHGKWNGGTGHPITETVLITIPVGETGYFCMDPNIISEAVRTWKSRDEIQFKLIRVGTPVSGNFQNLTLGVCYEITEEYMLDNDYPPNL